MSLTCLGAGWSDLEEVRMVAGVCCVPSGSRRSFFVGTSLLGKGRFLCLRGFPK